MFRSKVFIHRASVIRSPSQRQKNFELSLFAGLKISDCDVAAEFARNERGLIQAEAIALNVTCIGTAPEAVENIWHLAVGNASSDVADGENISVLILVDRHGDAAAVTVFDGVFQKLREDPAYAALIR